jgi:hypothetical protein
MVEAVLHLVAIQMVLINPLEIVPKGELTGKIMKQYLFLRIILLIVLFSGLAIHTSSIAYNEKITSPTNYSDPEIKSFLVEKIINEDYTNFCKKIDSSSFAYKKSNYIFECSNFESTNYVKYKKSFSIDSLCQTITGFDSNIVKSKDSNCYVPSGLNINFSNINSDSTKGFTNW